jgi:PAS domain S-box-containing protein
LFEQLLDSPGEKFRHEYRIAGVDGDHPYMEASVWNLLDNPFVEGIVVNAHEITERKERERERANE